MTTPADTRALDLAALRAALAGEREARAKAEADLIEARARVVSAEAMIEHLKLMIAKLRRALYGQSSERGQKLLDKLEAQLEDLEAAAGEDEVQAAKADEGDIQVRSFTRRPPNRAPLPAHLPRERVVVPAPTACPCCGGKLAKLGEDVTETLEVVPRTWKVIQTVREKFSCRNCEKITQPPAPFHPIPRGRAGPSLLAMILHAKFALHQPLNRQSETYAREGIQLGVSTLAGWVGACAALLEPLHELIRAHVLAAERLHGDDTPVPVLAKKKCVKGRLWTYVRDDRPFGGTDPPAALFFYSRDRCGIHPKEHLSGWAGILQADAYAGFNHFYALDREPAPIIEAGCWSHGRRKFYVLADTQKSPMALLAVRRIDEIFAIERKINGHAASARLARRRADIKPLVDDLKRWMKAERAKLSRNNPLAKAMTYMLKRWASFTRFLDDGRICLTNNAAERALRCIALGRRNWTFAGSDRGGQRAAALYTLIETAKLNDVDPRAWLADVLARINDHPASRLDELLPWNWKSAQEPAVAA